MGKATKTNTKSKRTRSKRAQTRKKNAIIDREVSRVDSELTNIGKRSLAPPIGSNLYAYARYRNGSGWETCNKTDAGAVAECGFQRWLRVKHHIFKPTGDDLLLLDHPANISMQNEMQINPEKFQRVSFKQKMQHLKHWESFVCFVYPTSAHAGIIRRWLTCTPESEFIEKHEYCAASYTMLQFYIEVLFADRNKYWDINGERIYGRACGIKKLNAMATAINWYHSEIGLLSSCPTMNDGYQQLRKIHEGKKGTVGARSVDAESALPDFFKSVWSNENSSVTNLEKTRNWLMILMMWNFMMRPSEIVQYCPLVENLKIL